ncbi:bifunctional folylpolyglutamate synthase/dihydrofolate synthase [Pseudanabaena sp. ABRG5-3]|uniref:bifunctional folylpolyglutamate synthase/dihydrofolate synthase n=1 Tax=Pseudanabaena sp. ABRG5-3 TaxID=685565 RepID=UPI000DC6E1A0|nr:folylpolyglutamate synthase/dihydrofolate synthase family protein [Pseudanabaena sp. ABRG5-3]BBC25823.1 bifunctional folylpolyglutamate synthase/ dihydrofolate synthase [Pseudanabaena sp. ABRG5-3]
MSPKLINSSPEAYLDSFDKFGIHLGLERIQQLLDALGNPHQQIPVIHVAGTNGKGSVCAFLLSILQAAGYRVGRYTSPHLIDWRERITINGEWISDRDLLEALQQVESAINPEFPPTQFEVITAAMWWYFATQKVDIAILETGLGGRLDATNVCDRPLVSVITSIGLDHCQQLGNTLGAIASEKAGIIKPKCPVVIAENHAEAIAVLQAKVTECEAPITWVSAAKPTATGAIYQGFEYPLTLLGKHQLINSAVAIATIQSLQNQGWEISEAAMRQGLANTQWSGRLQWIEFNLDGKSHKILIDGAHNVAAAEYLRQFVDEAFPHRRKRWVIGILNTKDQAGILKALLAPDDLLFPVPVPSAATTSPQDLAQIVSSMIKVKPHPYASLNLGLAEAFEDQQNDVVILCGSLYLVGEFLSQIAST